eukprot:189595_1
MSPSLSKLQIHQIIVFTLTFWSYVSLHTSRQAYSNAKQNMIDDWGFTKYPLEGTMDAVFLFAYAIGLYISGYIGDLFDATKVLSFGLFMTGIIIFIFGSSVSLFNIHNTYYFIILWMFNGLIQSTGWPTSVKIMGKYFGENHAGFIFGIWSANASVGNIVGAAMVSYVHSNKYSDQWMFYLPAFQLWICSFLIFVCIKTDPSKWDIIIHNNNNNNNNNNQHINDNKNVSSMWNVKHVSNDKSISSIGPATNIINTEEPLIKQDSKDIIDYKNVTEQKVTFCDALCIPNVLTYAFCYAFLKSVNYTMFFWLPYFLNNVFSETVSDNLSIVYNIGQIFGGWVCGWISDYLRRRSPPVFIFLLIAIPPIFLLRIKSHSVMFFGILSFLSGFFVGGPANMISSAISADLGKHKSLMGNTAALATVAGIIDGTGSFGAAICQYVVALISNIWGWDLVFAILAVLLLSSAGLLLKLAIKEVKILIKYGRKESSEIQKQYGIQAIEDDNVDKTCCCCYIK